MPARDVTATPEPRPVGSPEGTGCQGVGKAAPRQSQGNTGNTTSGLVEVGAPPGPEDAGERLRARIAVFVRAGERWPALWDGRDRGWRRPPGVAPWWEARQHAGGRVSPAEFRAAVNGLLLDGELIEVWLAPRGRRLPAHALLLPGCSAALARPVVRASGRADVIACEPWGTALVGAPRG